MTTSSTAIERLTVRELADLGLEMSERRTDAHRAPLLLGLVVEDGRALVGRAHARSRPGSMEQGLAKGCLAVVAVTDDGDGADAVGGGHRHGFGAPVEVAEAR